MPEDRPGSYNRIPDMSDNIAEPDSGGLFVILGTTSRRPHVRVSPQSTTVQNAVPMVRCNLLPVDQYTILPGTIAAFCCIFGVLYCLFGYRYFKATMFLTGFLFGSIITYLICLEENLLPPEGKLGVALGAGILCGIITTLVRYVGVFLTGFHLGFLLAVVGLVTAEPFVSPPPTTNKWVPIGTVMGTGVLAALAGLYAQKAITVLATGLIGAAMMAVGTDYYIELHGALRLVVERLKAEPTLIDTACWVTWLTLGLTPGIAIVGILVQWRVTSRGHDHKNVVLIRRRQKGGRHGGLESGPDGLGSGSAHSSSHHHKLSEKGSRQKISSHHHQHNQPTSYRHLYQIRRFNGDVIAQNYSFQIQDGHPQRHR